MTTINAQTIINAVMQAHAVAPLNKDAGFFDKIKFQTAERGFHSIHNSQEHLQRFADLVRKNARFFGGGLDKVQKDRAAVSYPSKTLTMFKQLIEDKDYSAALDLANEKLSPLFYVCQKGQAFMQVAPVPCEFDARLVSVLNEGGKYSVIEPVSMCSVNGASYVQKGNRAGQLENVEQRFKTFSSESVEAMFSNTLRKPADQAAIRTQWMIEHGIESSETIAARIESEELAREEEKTLGQRFDEERAKRKAAREAQAAQDVAQVVANAVAAAAISEAMQASEAGELVTCEAGENEANAPSMGSASTAPAWQPVPQYVPPVPSSTDFGQSKPPAFRGDDMPDSGDDAPATPSEPSNPAPATTQGGTGGLPVQIENETADVDAMAPVVGSTATPAPAVVEFLPKDTRISYSKIKRGTAFTFALNGPVFVKSVNGFRPGRGGDLMMAPAEMLVYPFSLDATPTPQAMESQPAVVAPSVETIQAAPDTLESFDSSGDGVSGELCDAIDRATVAQVQALTPDQFARLYSHLENWNFHTENYMLQALRLGDSSIIADMRQIVADQNAAGCLHGDVYTRRLAITARMDAIKQAQDAPTIKSKSGNWNAWLFITAHGTFGLRFESKTIGNVDSTHGTAKERMTYLTTAAKSADFVPPNPPGKTEGREGSPVQISTPKPVETFKQAGPVRVDLASMIAKGVAPEALIGLGVYCKGDMANPSGSGAITGFSHSDFYGLVVDVTLESGKVWRAVRTGEFLTGWFSLDAKMHGAPYLAQLAATVASLKASASATKEQAGNARAKALIDLAEQYPQLKRAETSYAGGKLAAANMRILLKAAFKGVKFSVTSDYNSVRVNWEDGPTDDQVNEVVGRFDIGASDAHSDYFYTVSTAFSDLFGGVQYLHTRRHESDALVQQAIDELYQNRDEKPTVQDYRKCSGVFNWDGQNYENRRMRELMNSTPAFSATKSHAKS